MSEKAQRGFRGLFGGKKEPRTDGWSSLVTGHGTVRDRATSFGMIPTRLDYVELRNIYRGDGMAARVVDLLPAEMTRKGIDLAIQSADGFDGQAVRRALLDRLDELGFNSKLKLALCWARAFGGSAILLGVNDGSPDLSAPLNAGRVLSIDWLTVMTRQELQACEWYDDPRHPKYGEPSLYNIVAVVPTTNGLMQRVHESRLLRFDGVKLTREEERENRGWGDSVLPRLFDALRDFGAAWSGAAHLISDYGQGVLTIPGLLDSVAGGNGEWLQSRLANFDRLRSTVRAVVVDGGGREGGAAETFTRMQTPLTGLADMIDRFDKRIASIAGVPVSLLTGESLSGLNASGGVNAGWWDDHVAASREELLRPPVNRVVKLMLLAKSGPTSGVEPESWRVEFPPLRELSEVEKTSMRNIQSQTDRNYVEMGAVDPSEIAVSRFGGDEWSGETVLDVEARSVGGGGDEEESPEGSE